MSEQLKPFTLGRAPSRRSFIDLAPWLVCLVVAAFYWYDFMLRAMPGVLIVPLMRDLHVGAFHVGLLATLYYYAYCPLQLIAGAVVDRFTRRWVLFFSCLVSAAGGIVFSVSTDFVWVAVGRNLMGVGTAFAFVGALKLAAMRLPHRAFVFYTGAMLSLGMLGALTTDVVLAPSAEAFGWRNTVFATAVVGVLLAVVMLLVAKDRPRWLPKSAPKSGSMGSFVVQTFAQFRYGYTWLIGVLGGLMLLPISVFASFWYVLFLKQTYHVANVSAAMTAGYIFVGFIIGAPCFAWWSNKINRRKLPVVLASALVVVLTALVVYVTTLPRMGLLLLLFLLGFFTAAQVLIFAVVKELSGLRNTGVAMASVNFLITLTPLLFQPWVGLWLTKHWHGSLSASGVPMFSHQNYEHAFVAMLCLLVLAFILACLMPETYCRSRAQQASLGAC